MIAGDNPYEKLDVLTLTNLLINPDNDAEIHRAALSALARVNPAERRSRLVVVMRNVVRMPDRYNQDVMMSLIDLLATDPDADATLAMIDILREILALFMKDPDADATLAMIDILREILALFMKDRDALKPEFREYFYQALVTRQRPDDLAVWAEMLPTLDSKTLVAAVLDPAAQALEALEPITLLDRQPEPTRTKALLSVVLGLILRNGSPEQLQQAVLKLKERSDAAQLAQGIGLLTERWEKANRGGNRRQAALLYEALAALDTRPRSAAERLMGKRPWAS